jgi:MoaA/NifB/PqqE/SkfB family radical SAM enzyme
MDMLSYVKSFFSKTPPYLIFYVTGKCNAKCVHCFNWKLSQNDLSLDEISKIAKNWGKLLILNLGGGEPFLRDDIIRIVEKFDYYAHPKIIAIPTNGILTDKIRKNADYLLTRFPHIFFRFTVSIDGFEEVHDQIRGVKCFGRAIETIRQLKWLKGIHSNFSLLSNSCFMQQNQDTLLDTIKYLKDLVDFPSVTFIRGDPKNNSSKTNLDIDKYAEILKYLKQIDYSQFNNHPLSGFIRNASILARDKVLETLRTGKRNFKCYALERMVVVDNTGEVLPCEIFNSSVGNLRDCDYDIKNIRTKKIICQIPCTWECAVRTGIIYNPLEWRHL